MGSEIDPIESDVSTDAHPNMVGPFKIISEMTDTRDSKEGDEECNSMNTSSGPSHSKRVTNKPL